MSFILLPQDLERIEERLKAVDEYNSSTLIGLDTDCRELLIFVKYLKGQIDELKEKFQGD